MRININLEFIYRLLNNGILRGFIVRNKGGVGRVEKFFKISE